MGRKAKIYDEAEIIRLYEKYGVIEDVRIRLSMSPVNIKKILEKNNIEIIKGVKSRKQICFGKSLYGR